MKKILVLGGQAYVEFISTLKGIKIEVEIESCLTYKLTEKIFQKIAEGVYDLIVFSGGSDVSPIIYNQEKSHVSITDEDRDEAEMMIYENAIKSKTPMLGICRGAQFITAMQDGGALLQHVEGHLGDHLIEIDDEYIPEEISDTSIMTTSTHHQMMDLRQIDKDKYVLIGKVSTKKAENDRMLEIESCEMLPIPFDHPEIVYYIDTDALAVQGHPEHYNSGRIRNNFGILVRYLIVTLLLKEKYEKEELDINTVYNYSWGDLTKKKLIDLKRTKIRRTNQGFAEHVFAPGTTGIDPITTTADDTVNQVLRFDGTEAVTDSRDNIIHRFNPQTINDPRNFPLIRVTEIGGRYIGFININNEYIEVKKSMFLANCYHAITRSMPNDDIIELSEICMLTWKMYISGVNHDIVEGIGDIAGKVLWINGTFNDPEVNLLPLPNVVTAYIFGEPEEDDDLPLPPDDMEEDELQFKRR